MYAIFSSWKFYTKERGLLKKYLKECNIIADPNMMSTIELKENAQRFSNLKKSNYCESLSSGTPFTSTDRVLNSNSHALNSASPNI